MSDQILPLEIPTRPSGGSVRQAPGEQPAFAPARRLPIAELLGLLAGEGERSSEGERDIVASALCRALETSSTNEFPSLGATLDGHRDEITRRARRCQNSDLELQGFLEKAPFLALCAEVHRSGFVDADGKEARSKLFLALADLVTYRDELEKTTSFKSASAGLRLLIQRLIEAPKAGVSTHHFSVWELIGWIDAHDDLADYVKRAARSLRRNFVLAWNAPAPSDTESVLEDDDEGEATPEESTPDEIIWAIPESTRYECDLPPDLKQKLLSNELTRITALSRYGSASLLNYSDAQMQSEVTRLIVEFHRNPAEATHVLAQLLSIPTGTPVADVYRIPCAALDNEDPAPSYPGVLTDDGRWLIRTEYDPRPPGAREFQPRSVHVPIPEPLAELLRAQKGGLRAGMPVIATMSGANRPPTPRVASAWFTALASRLMREGRFGITLAQHVLHSSLGLDKAPPFYDRIPTDHIAHALAKITHPWFGTAGRPTVKGLPSHCIGSQRVVDRFDCRAFFHELRAGWSSELPLYKRIHIRCRNFRHGLLLAVAHRTNESITSITRATIARDSGLITLDDKAVALDYPTRLAAMGSKLIRELDDLLAELSAATDAYPDTALAQAAERILAGTQSLFLHVDSADACHAIDLPYHLADLPPWSEGIRNWTRHLANDELTRLVPEPLRVGQLGWHGTRSGAISELSTLSPLDVCSRNSRAVDDMLKTCGWSPLPSSGLPRTTVEPSIVHWAEACRAHQRDFDKGLVRLESAADAQRTKLAGDVLEGVNAFFRINGIPLEATAEGFVRQDAANAVLVGRDMHAALLRVMVADTNATVVAREVLHAWLHSARRSKVISGPLPRQIVRSRPRQPGPFLRSAHRSLEHRDNLLKLAHRSDLPLSARTFLTVLLEGWVPDAGVVLALMRPGARLHDLRDRNLLLIEANRSLEADNGVNASGCLAFDGTAAIALRAWHRGGKASPPDADALRQEIHGALSTALSTDVEAEAVFEELESLMRINLSLRAPGIVRDVVSRRVVPSFAPFDRVVALHEEDPICPQAPAAIPAASISAGIRKSRARRQHDGYNLIKDIVARFADRWTLGNDTETRAEAIAALRLLVPRGVPSTGVHIVALYAAAYLTEGLHKARVRPVSVQDVVYSVGHALSDAIPEQADLSQRKVWVAAYARAFAACEKMDRPRLAKDLTHFQKVMAREFTLPVVDLAPLLDALEVPSPPEPVGFFTAAEQAALVCFGRLRMEAAIAEGSPAEQEVALNALAITACGLSTSMRDREIRVPRVSDWNAREAEHPYLALRSNGVDFVKSEAGRRSLNPSGRFSNLAVASIDRLTRLKQSREVRTPRKLFLIDSGDFDSSETQRQTVQINADIRCITGCPLAAFDIMRKDWARRSFDAIGADHPSLWPTRDYLSAMGQAGIATTLGHYLHDPVTFLMRMPRRRDIEPAEVGWILEMLPRTATRLLNQENSWLRPGVDRQFSFDSDVSMLPELPGFGTFAPTVGDAAAVLAIVAEGQSVECALRTLGWPTRFVPLVTSALEDLASHGISICPQRADGMELLKPPSRKHGHEALERSCADPNAVDALAWIFRSWMADWRKRNLKGFTARSSEWTTHVPETSPLHRLPWQQEPDGYMTYFSLPGERAHGHSGWVELRWSALAAWLIVRLTQLVSTYLVAGNALHRMGRDSSAQNPS